MDASPLIKAHDHARAALEATRSSDSTVAVNEHALAAGEFSNAAKSTGSTEALRTLKLLEQHHKKLSEILQLPSEPPRQQTTGDEAVPGDEGKKTGQSVTEDDSVVTKEKPEGTQDAAAVRKSAASHKPKPSLTLHQQRRYATRDLSSSIASNLATARGIRTGQRVQPLVPSVSNDQAPGNLEIHPRREAAEEVGKPSWVPPTPGHPGRTDPQQLAVTVKAEERPTSPGNDGYSRFYNAFGSILNRISAPLAFAGLPLIAEESTAPEPTPVSPPEQTNPRRSRSRLPQTVSTEPDLAKIYSKATLRALGNRPNDSFYVVPTSGHTASYASILSFDQKERRRLMASASIHHDPSKIEEDPDEDDFVDAREVPVTSPIRKRLSGDISDRKAQTVIEELHLENAHLKEMLDKVSKRLHAFEIGSQSSHLALAQSLRMHRPGSPMSGSGGGRTEIDEALKRRNQELEEKLAQAMRRLELLEQEMGKKDASLEKYRERWEKLKAGAKARREKGSANDGEASRS
ncbi:hypothetical protein DL546_008236 [Coniochaeta pulveracea]|uniref:Uncharacterized protein n=1 Tax=Coniochaeta pulveracea TaxID=177199 RepID=A0A420YI77_9PEZI|nr:hypothetical protein DL546_008236 [Coniochaeta pulveracea]